MEAERAVLHQGRVTLPRRAILPVPPMRSLGGRHHLATGHCVQLLSVLLRSGTAAGLQLSLALSHLLTHTCERVLVPATNGERAFSHVAASSAFGHSAARTHWRKHSLRHVSCDAILFIDTQQLERAVEHFCLDQRIRSIRIARVA